MAREKKDSLPLHVKIDSELMLQFESYCRQVGWTKTTGIERILKSYLDEKVPIVAETKK